MSLHHICQFNTLTKGSDVGEHGFTFAFISLKGPIFKISSRAEWYISWRKLPFENDLHLSSQFETNHTIYSLE